MEQIFYLLHLLATVYLIVNNKFHPTRHPRLLGYTKFLEFRLQEYQFAFNTSEPKLVNLLMQGYFN